MIGYLEHNWKGGHENSLRIRDNNFVCLIAAFPIVSEIYWRSVDVLYFYLCLDFSLFCSILLDLR